ncbi:MAG: nitronate monooxygenase [Candidatus Eremiobacterota bacterium]
MHQDHLDNYRWKLGASELVPLVIGGMGVDISTADLALEAARLGGVGHISDAMVCSVSDRRFGTTFSRQKFQRHRYEEDRSRFQFDLEDLREAQRRHVESTMARKRGPGLIFLNVMEKLTMGAPGETLKVRMEAGLDAGIDGLTLSAGLHHKSLKLIEDHPRFRDVKLGIIVSSLRALEVFLRAARRCDRMPDYVVVEGPLAGGHLGFGEDWAEHRLDNIVAQIVAYLREQNLDIAVIPAGGIFTGTDATDYLRMGAAAVQVATRFTVTRECGLPDAVKQEYFRADESDVVVNCTSPTGYLMRMLTSSPCLRSNVKPMCKLHGYMLSREGACPYVDAWEATGVDERGRKLPVREKMCLCHHFSRHQCYTCGHYAYRLKDTSRKGLDGNYHLLAAEHVFRDYQLSREHRIRLPEESLPLPPELPRMPVKLI